MSRGRVRWTEEPAGLRPGQVRVDNLALVPASLLPYKAHYQKLANQLPAGAVLVVLPTDETPEKQALQQAAARFLAKGHPVTTLSTDEVLALTTRRRLATGAEPTGDVAAPPLPASEPSAVLSTPTVPATAAVPGAAPPAVPPFERELRLVSVDPSRNRARFYILQWHPTLWEDLALVRIWGRIGSRGQAKVLLHAPTPQVDAVIERLVRRRLQHGYQVVDWQ